MSPEEDRRRLLAFGRMIRTTYAGGPLEDVAARSYASMVASAEELGIGITEPTVEDEWRDGPDGQNGRMVTVTAGVYDPQA